MAKEKLNMLIVDDEMEILRILRDVFELRGWKIITTPTASPVLSIIESERLDVVLLDIRLPDGSGLDVLKNIKKKYPSMPVIIFTALGYEDELVNKAIRLGASGYVAKNVPIHELIEVVNNTIIKK